MDFIGDLIPKCDFKIKHVYQEDRGFRLAKSRNNAARVAEGDWLVFLDQDIIFGGRLGTYKYLDMDKVIKICLDDVKREFGE